MICPGEIKRPQTSLSSSSSSSSSSASSSSYSSSFSTLAANSLNNQLCGTNNNNSINGNNNNDERFVETGDKRRLAAVVAAGSSRRRSAINFGRRFFVRSDYKPDKRFSPGADGTDPSGGSRAPPSSSGATTTKLAPATTAAPQTAALESVCVSLCLRSQQRRQQPLAPGTTELATTMVRRNPQLRSSISLIQNAPREKPEHLFEELDTASLDGVSNQSIAATTHLSFPYPPYSDHSRLTSSSAAAAASQLLESADDRGAVASSSSYDALTSLLAHVDKVKRKVALALGQSLASSEAGQYTLSMLGGMASITNQQVVRCMKEDMNLAPSAERPQQNPHQQMLLAVQHLTERRNELRAMDNHLFQLISYCLTQVDSAQRMEPHQQHLEPTIYNSPQSAPLEQPIALCDLSKRSPATVADGAPRPQLPAASSCHETSKPQELKRTVNLKKSRLLASTNQYCPPNECVNLLPEARISTSKEPPAHYVSPSRDPDEPHMLKKCRMMTSSVASELDHLSQPSSLHQPVAPSAGQSFGASPFKYAGYPTDCSLLTRTYPPIASLGPLDHTTFDRYEQMYEQNSGGCHPASLPCLQTFDSMALNSQLYSRPDKTEHSRSDLYCNLRTPINMTNERSHQSIHTKGYQLSLLGEPPAQAIQHRQLRMPFRCHVCGSGFEDKHRLQQHLSIHLSLHPSWFEEKTIKETMAQYESKRGDYLCSTCNVRYETTAEFDKHMQLHGDKPHRCDLCDQDNKIVSFRYYRQLLTHLRSHCFLYSCRYVSDCKQTANRKDYLKLHILKHHLNNKLPDQHIVCCHWKHGKPGATSN